MTTARRVLGTPDVLRMTRDPNRHPRRFKYDHGMFIEELIDPGPIGSTSSKWPKTRYEVYEAGSPISLAIGEASTLGSAERLAARYAISRLRRTRHARSR
jgi:hypothetical protein